MVDIELIASMVGVTFEWTPSPPNDRGGGEDGGGGGPFLISCLLNVDLRFNEIFGKSLRLKVIERVCLWRAIGGNVWFPARVASSDR